MPTASKTLASGSINGTNPVPGVLLYEVPAGKRTIVKTIYLSRRLGDDLPGNWGVRVYPIGSPIRPTVVWEPITFPTGIVFVQIPPLQVINVAPDAPFQNVFHQLWCVMEEEQKLYIWNDTSPGAGPVLLYHVSGAELTVYP